ARPGLERTRGPSRSNPEVLEQDRTELDQPGGRLAPGDDGVHAGTVAVVGADAAVAVAIERGGVGTGAAITFAGDQIDEFGFLGLLHDALTTILMGTWDPGARLIFLVCARGAAGSSGAELRGFPRSICRASPHAKG